MHSFFLLHRPLPKRTLTLCHIMAQLGLIVGGIAWFLQHSPWLAPASWSESWPTLALGSGVVILAMVGVRLLAELLMLPHHLAGQRQGFTPSAVVTRSFERRPAVHDPQGGWVNETRPARTTILDEEAVGNVRVVQPRRSTAQRRAATEPTLDRPGDAGEPGHAQRRQEPSM